MKFKPDEIVSVLTREISGLGSGQDVREVGTLEVGDGIARVYGLSAVMAGEMVEFTRTKIRALAFNLEESSVAVIILGDYPRSRRATRSARPASCSASRWATRLIGRVVDPLGNPLDEGPDHLDRDPADGVGGGRRGRAAAGQGPPPDGHQGHRRHDPDRPGPARADHRRPEDRQDGHRHRHDHQPEDGKRRLRVRGLRADAGQDQPGGRGPAGPGRWTTPSWSFPSSADPAPIQYYAPYAGTAMAEYFMNKGRTPWSRTTTCPSRPPPTGSSPCWSAARRAARPTPATCSTPTAGSWSGRQAGRPVGDRPERRRRQEGDRRLGGRAAADSSRKRNGGEPGKVYVGPSELTGKAYAEHHDPAKFPATSWPAWPRPAGR